MSNDLTVSDIKLSGPWQTEPDLEHGKRENWYTLSISATNTSANTTYHVISDIRHLSYDAPSRTLNVQLAEELTPMDLGTAHVELILPRLKKVSPGETVILEVFVPEVIKRLVPSPETLGQNIEQIDILGVENVRCTISYNDTPLERLPAETRIDVLKRYTAWSRIHKQMPLQIKRPRPRWHK